VFTYILGGPPRSSQPLRAFKCALACAGRPVQRFHDLRRATASLLLAPHVPPRVVMEIQGHTQGCHDDGPL
jgi:integrase